MVKPFRFVKNKIRNSQVCRPWLYREYVYIRDSYRIFNRVVFHNNDWRQVTERAPSMVGFNITDRCNANCCYCAHRFNQPEGRMSIRVFEKGIRDFSAMGGGTIGLSPLTGEPLLDPFFTERVRFAAQIDNILKICLDTNGILLQEDGVREELVQLSSHLPIEINISLPGFDKESFEPVTNVRWNDGILHGIKSLLKTRAVCEGRLHVVLSIQPDRAGVLECHNFREHIRPYILDDDIILDGRIRDNWCGQIQQSDLTGDMVLRRQVKLVRIPCHVMMDGHVDILFDGSVRICGCRYGADGKYDELIIGNIMEQSLSDIWFGERAREASARFTRKDIPEVCRQCRLYLPA